MPTLGKAGQLFFFLRKEASRARFVVGGVADGNLNVIHDCIIKSNVIIVVQVVLFRLLHHDGDKLSSHAELTVRFLH